LVALAFIFSYIEHLIPLPLPTGVKLGAANIVVLCALYFFGWKEALAVSLVRIVLSGVAFGISTVPYSLAGGVLSLFVMSLLKRKESLGVTGVSVAGSVCHNIGQTLVAMALLPTAMIFTSGREASTRHSAIFLPMPPPCPSRSPNGYSKPPFPTHRQASNRPPKPSFASYGLWTTVPLWKS